MLQDTTQMTIFENLSHEGNVCMHTHTHKLCLLILYYSYSHIGVNLFPADKSQELAGLEIKLDGKAQSLKD